MSSKRQDQFSTYFCQKTRSQGKAEDLVLFVLKLNGMLIKPSKGWTEDLFKEGELEFNRLNLLIEIPNVLSRDRQSEEGGLNLGLCIREKEI